MANDDDGGCCCYFHPDEVFVGVCPLCLYERLLVVATKQCRRRRGLRLYTSTSSSRCKSSNSKPTPRIILPKIMHFAIDSLFHRNTKTHLLNLKHHHTTHDHIASPTQDDSFISIRFDDNNTLGAWEKGKDCKSVVEHPKPQWYSVRWRRQIGHVFQLITWKKYSNRHNVGSGRVVKGGQWIRNLMRRKTTSD